LADAVPPRRHLLDNAAVDRSAKRQRQSVLWVAGINTSVGWANDVRTEPLSSQSRRAKPMNIYCLVAVLIGGMTLLTMTVFNYSDDRQTNRLFVGLMIALTCVIFLLLRVLGY
jgi:hypothetical protein